MNEISGGLVGPRAAITFIKAFLDAPDDTDIEVRLGTDVKTGKRVVLCIVGSFIAGLTAYEARTLADGAEKAWRAFPHDPETRGFLELIMGLRAAADKLDRGDPK